MSVYSLDIYRLPAMVAKRILLSGIIPYEPTSITKMDDSIVLEYESWHGSPEPEYEMLLADEQVWLHANQNNDEECFIEDRNAPCHWKKALVISTDPDGYKYLDWKEIGKPITLADVEDIRDAMS